MSPSHDRLALPQDHGRYVQISDNSPDNSAPTTPTSPSYASTLESPNSSHSSFDLDDLANTDGQVTIPDDGTAYDDNNTTFSFSWRKLWAFTGPGFIMSIAYIDPGNLESDLQAGAYTGYQLIWVLLLSTMCGLVMQVFASRLGVVTGKNLAQHCRAEYNRKTSVALWLMTEIAIIGSDIQEVVGSAIAFRILFGIPLWAGVLITAVDTFTFLGIQVFGVRKLEIFVSGLISTICICFFIDFGYVKPSASGIARGFLPTLDSYALFQAIGIIGAVIMPHNMYLHSALVQSRAVDRTKKVRVQEANYYFLIESSVALFISFIINLTVIAVFAAQFFSPLCAPDSLALVDGICQAIGLEEAGDALENALGKTAPIIWAIGLLAAGQSSTMTGTYAGQFVMSGFLNLQLSPWQRVAVTRTIALLPAMLVALIGSGQEDTLDQFLNILQSIQLPFAVLPLLRFTCDPRIMGEHVNHPFWTFVGWFLSFIFIATNFYLIIDFLMDNTSPVPHEIWFYCLCAAISLLYICFIIYLISEDVLKFFRYLYIKIYLPSPKSSFSDSDSLLASKPDGSKYVVSDNVKFTSDNIQYP